MLEDGVATVLLPVVVLSPVLGDHANVVAPFACNVALLPAQTDCVGDTLSVGNAFTVTAIVLVLEQPFCVPVTVYVMFDGGLALTVAPVLLFNAVSGDQL